MAEHPAAPHRADLERLREAPTPIQRLVSHSSRRVDVGVIAALCIGLLASQPLFFGGLAAGPDTSFHLNRLWQVLELWRHGILYSRWAPDLLFGFGYPVFNYYGLLSYFVAGGFALASGSIVGGISGAFVLANLLAASGMFVWLRRVFGDSGALVASAAYVFSPYLVGNMHLRGMLPVVLAVACVPWVMAGLRGYVTDGSHKHALLLVISFAATCLTHNVTALMLAVAYALYGVILSGASPRRLAAAVCLALAGFALAAFYLLPALLEANQVQLSLIYANPNYDYGNNFLSLTNIFDGPVAFDPNAIRGYEKVFVGIVPAVLSVVGLAGLVAWKRLSRDHVHHVVFGLLGCGLCIYLSASVSRPVWDALPFMRVLQFPDRWLALNSLFLAVLVGAGVGCVARLSAHVWPQVFAGGLGVILVSSYAFPMMFVPSRVDKNYTTDARTITAMEKQFEVLGTTNTGEYLPVAVKAVPPLALSPQTRNFDPFDPASLPVGATVADAEYRPLAYALTVDATRQWRAQFATFYFPGWRATVDGASTTIDPSDPYGLIQVTVPAGRHRLEVWFGSTPLRTVALLISVATLVGLALVTVFTFRGRNTVTDARQGAEQARPVTGLFIAAVVIGLFALKTSVVDNLDTPFKFSRFDGQKVTALQHQADVNFDNRIVYLGSEFAPKVESGSQVFIAAFWRNPAPGGTVDTSLAYELLDLSGRVVAQSTRQHPADTPSHVWQAHQYARDAVTLLVPGGTPPGDYELRVAAFGYDAFAAPLSVRNTSGGVSGVYATMGRVRVERGTFGGGSVTPPVVARVAATASSESVLLMGQDALPSSVHTGDRLQLVLYWRARVSPSGDSNVRITVVGSDGTSVALPPMSLSPGFPTSQWRAGDEWRVPLDVIVPATLVSGEYRLRVQVDSGQSYELGSVAVQSPAHVFSAPDELAERTGQAAQFGDLAELVGYAVSGTIKPGQTLPLTLVWKALGASATTYKVFVHLLDDHETLVAADDRGPAGWSRPTTGWVAPEYIVDQHDLVLPASTRPGRYVVEVGLYEDGGAGARLPLTNGATSIRLATTVFVGS